MSPVQKIDPKSVSAVTSGVRVGGLGETGLHYICVLGLKKVACISSQTFLELYVEYTY